MALDFEKIADSTEKPKATLEQLQALINEADMLDKQIDELNNMLSTMTTRYNFIKTKLIVDVMTEMQSTSWTSEGGTKIEIADFVAGSLPKEEEKRDAAIKHLEENDGGSLLKTSINLEFSKSQHNEALAMADDLRQKGYEPVIKSDVHSQTLMAFARERLKSGGNIDLEVLGLFSGRVAKITHAGKASPTKAKQPKKTKGPTK